MNIQLKNLFENKYVRKVVRRKLPYLFTIANIENSRGGKVGMQVGNTREQILIALLIWQLGEENTQGDVPATKAEVDAYVFGEPISIKTITNNGGVKVNWTVDTPSVQEFLQNYKPLSDIILVQIKWNLSERALKRGTHPGGLFYIPIEVQQKILSTLGPTGYVKPPKIGTNPRGPELTKEALQMLFKDQSTVVIDIIWEKADVDITPYSRCIDY